MRSIARELLGIFALTVQEVAKCRNIVSWWQYRHNLN